MIDGYSIEPITGDNVIDRKYYGVTHILPSDANAEDSIQVIVLEEVRRQLGITAAFVAPEA